MSFESAYEPPWWLPRGDLETMLPVFWPTPAIAGPTEGRVIRVHPRASVRVDVDRPPQEPRGTLLLLHGLRGSSSSSYVLNSARAALARGYVSARMNARNCGGTQALAETLTNGGQSDDVRAVLEELDRGGFPRPFVGCGFSLGGNLILRYVGLATKGSLLDAVAGVNPTIDLECCAQALELPRNRHYQAYFTWSLCRLLRTIRRHRQVPGPWPTWRSVRTLRQFDHLYTAPDAGYDSAEEYYAGASAAPLIGAITIPTLILSARNDPFVPPTMFEAAQRSAPDNVKVVLTRRGGHVGFRQSAAQPFWAADAVLDFFETVSFAGLRPAASYADD